MSLLYLFRIMIQRNVEITCSADSKKPLEYIHNITELNDYDKLVPVCI